MPVAFTLPLSGGKPHSVRDIVFSILTTKHPLSLIELQHAVKDYGRETTFQAVRQAALQLVEEGILAKEDKKYEISRQWILELGRFGSILQKQYFASHGKETTRIEAGPNMTTYTIPQLIDMDAVWDSVVKEGFQDKNQPKVIVFAAVHYWWVLANLAQETELMKGLGERGIKSYFICYGDTPLDKWAIRYYNDIGVQCIHQKRPRDFASGHNIGVYGDVIIQATHPPEIAKRIEALFKKCKSAEEIRLAELMEPANELINIKMTVIKDPILATALREKTLSEFHKRLKS